MLSLRAKARKPVTITDKSAIRHWRPSRYPKPRLHSTCTLILDPTGDDQGCGGNLAIEASGGARRSSKVGRFAVLRSRSLIHPIAYPTFVALKVLGCAKRDSRYDNTTKAMTGKFRYIVRMGRKAMVMEV